MRARIQDAHALRAVTPAGLAAYVLAEGWKRVERFGDHSDVWMRMGSPELIVPGTDALADYATVVSEILRLLADAEGRDELQVYRDLASADRDVIRVRSASSDDDGSIAIGVGVDMVIQARDMLQASACAATEPRAAYRAGRVKEAASYMDRVRMGQTEQGSFVVTMLAPVPPTFDLDQGAFWPGIGQEPFERRVTRTLASGLDAARAAAEEAVRGGGFGSFERAVRRGVNANLCEALSTLIGHSDGLEVSVSWAKTRPAPERLHKVRFTSSEGEILSEAARLFRSMEPRLDETLHGYVVSSGRPLEQQQGRVTLKTFIDGQPVSVSTTLTPSLYREALAAHLSKAAVAINGDLRRRGQRWELENPRHLRLVEDDEVGGEPTN
jgi:hypothetical protein